MSREPDQAPPVELDHLEVRGAREHNLKNIDLRIPKKKLVVFTGVSGSGKSSMAFDTIFAEGQRRYVESLSAYARQFLGQMEKPLYDSIRGLSPTISIEQKTASRNPRSTVGTITEIFDYLRVLFARAGTQHCHQCQRVVEPQPPQLIVDELEKIPEGTKYLLLAPLIENRKGEYRELLDEVRTQGFARLRINGEVTALDEGLVLNKKKKNTVDVVVDRLVSRAGNRSRLSDSVETALHRGEGRCIVSFLDDAEDRLFSAHLFCFHCGLGFPTLTPQSFSFNNPAGMCRGCNGLGNALELDPDRVIPDPSKSVEDGAIDPWRGLLSSPSILWARKIMRAMAKKHGINLKAPFESYDQAARDAILYGTGEEEIKVRYRRGSRSGTIPTTWAGIVPSILKKWQESESDDIRLRLARYFANTPCAACNGDRLRPESAAVRLGSLTINTLNNLTIAEAYDQLLSLPLEGNRAMIAEELIKEVVGRLRFLKNVGLTYLTLSRPGPTLSGGESQRIRLASQMGSELTGVLYILDEPSIGLHPRDNMRLIHTLEHLRDVGNTVVVVEHDSEMMERCDWVVDFGPGAGINGGTVVSSGPPAKIMADPKSLTGGYLSGRLTIEGPATRREIDPKRVIRIEGARANNLQNMNAEIPIGVFTCVTGVSGAGKSSLINGILHPAAAVALNKASLTAKEHDQILGLEHFDKVINIDQSPIGRTPRSNPATYTKLWDDIRKVFAGTREARAYGYKPGRFSFNVKGGRCETCKGAGVLKIEMHFLADVHVPCDVCHGQRFEDSTLRVKYLGLTISDVLNTSIAEAAEVFKNHKKIGRILQTLNDVGLGYVALGQPSTTLSGGEAQRIKLSRELAKRATGRTLYILDEPSTGLHFEDIRKLLEVVQRLTSAGNTVVMIEHNLDIIKTADWIIDLGPEGGDGGGKIVAKGPPEKVARSRKSHTGRFLREALRERSATSD